MTNVERGRRRKRIADFVKAGNDCPEAARQFNVTLKTVYEACRIYNVPIILNELGPSTYEIISALIKERGSLRLFAERFKVSPQRIAAIRRKCIEAGIPLGVGNKLGYIHERLPA
jgi:hypothetical protein